MSMPRVPTTITECEEELKRFATIIEDKEQREQLLATTGDDAQKWLDSLQLLSEYPDVEMLLRSAMFNIMIRLSRKTGLHPRCLTIRGVERLGEHPVGGGAFGDVWKGKMGSKLVCMKVLRIFTATEVEQILKDFMQEAIVWRQLDHENLLPFMGIYYLDSNMSRLCLISPWMERGNLLQFMKNSPELVHHDKLAHDVACGLSHLHVMKIVHSDLKGVNILITADLRACVGDFGLSTISDTQRLFSSQTPHSGGTTRWLSPELLAGSDCVASKASDVYAYGQIYTGRSPFHELKEAAVMFAVVVNKKQPTRPRDSPVLRDEMWDTMVACWSAEPSSRPTIVDVLARVRQYLLTDSDDSAERDSSSFEYRETQDSRHASRSDESMPPAPRRRRPHTPDSHSPSPSGFHLSNDVESRAQVQTRAPDLDNKNRRTGSSVVTTASMVDRDPIPEPFPIAPPAPISDRPAVEEEKYKSRRLSTSSPVEDRRIIPLACRFIPYDQWLVTHIDVSWKISQLKSWFIAKCISNPGFTTFSGNPASIPFLHEPSNPRAKPPRRPASPIVFAPEPRGLAPLGSLKTSPDHPGGSERILDEEGTIITMDCEEDDEWGDSDGELSFSRRTGGGRLGRPQDVSHPNNRLSTSRSVAIEQDSHGYQQPHPQSHHSQSAAQKLSTYDTRRLMLIRFSTGQVLGDHFRVDSYSLSPYELIEIHRVGEVFSLPRTVVEQYVQPYWEGWAKSLRVIGKDPIPTKKSKWKRSGKEPGNETDTSASNNRRRRLKLDWRERWVFVKDGVLNLRKDRLDPNTAQLLPLDYLVEIRGSEQIGRSFTATSGNPPSQQRIVCFKFRPKTTLTRLANPPDSPLPPDAATSRDLNQGPPLSKERGKDQRPPDKEPSGSEWIILDLGDDHAYKSFLRILHRHAPHSIFSSFLASASLPPVPALSLPTPIPSPSRSPSPSPIVFSPDPRMDHHQQSENAAASTHPETVLEGARLPKSTSHSDTNGTPAPRESETFPLPKLPFSFPERLDEEGMKLLNTFGSLPYPEWRVALVTKARKSGIGGVNRAMEMFLWGDVEDSLEPGVSGIGSGVEVERCSSVITKGSDVGDKGASSRRKRQRKANRKMTTEHENMALGLERTESRATVASKESGKSRAVAVSRDEKGQECYSAAEGSGDQNGTESSNSLREPDAEDSEDDSGAESSEAEWIGWMADLYRQTTVHRDTHRRKKLEEEKAAAPSIEQNHVTWIYGDDNRLVQKERTALEPSGTVMSDQLLPTAYVPSPQHTPASSGTNMDGSRPFFHHGHLPAPVPKLFSPSPNENIGKVRGTRRSSFGMSPLPQRPSSSSSPRPSQSPRGRDQHHSSSNSQPLAGATGVFDRPRIPPLTSSLTQEEESPAMTWNLPPSTSSRQPSIATFSGPPDTREYTPPSVEEDSEPTREFDDGVIWVIL